MNKWKRPFRPYSKRGVSSEQPFTECLCPKCGLVHKMKIKWIGRGIPRKFCEKCSKSKLEDQNIYEIRYSEIVDY